MGNDRYPKGQRWYDRMNVVWKEQDIINGHILIAGGSGAGKTFNIRKIVREMVQTANHSVRVHVFDVHDDIDIKGCSEVFFSESSNYGLNPLLSIQTHTPAV